MSFAKIFESKKVGQILVKMDVDEESRPEVRYYFQPKDLGVCSMAFSFSDDDAGHDLAEAAFEASDLEKAERVIIGGMPPELIGEAALEHVEFADSFTLANADLARHLKFIATTGNKATKS